MFVIDSGTIHGFLKNGYYFQRTEGRELSNGLHAHTFYEFLCIVSGSCTHEIDGQKQTLHIGDLVAISPQSAHRFLSQKENTDLIVLSVVSDEVEKFFNLYETVDPFKQHAVMNIPFEKRQLLLSQCENVELLDSNEYIRHMRIILNYIFLFCMEPLRTDADIPPEFGDALKKLQEPSVAAKGVKSFLELSGYSHSQLCRLTKKYLGITPTEYVNQIRINHAYKLIVYSGKDYETICSEVGFESFSYFTKLLKKQFGCSASKIRKEFKYLRKTV